MVPAEMFGFEQTTKYRRGINPVWVVTPGIIRGRARVACDEAGHWMSRLARAEQVNRREEVKVAGSEN